MSEHKNKPWEKLAQNWERIPERAVRAGSSAPYGTHTITQDITKYSNAVSH